jgi:hypothetical protein
MFVLTACNEQLMQEVQLVKSTDEKIEMKVSSTTLEKPIDILSKPTTESVRGKKIRIKDLPFKIIDFGKPTVSHTKSMNSDGCTRTRTITAITLYEELPPKSVGYWYCIDTPWSQNPTWSEVKSTFGFSRILVYYEYFQNAINAGFQSSQMIVCADGYQGYLNVLSNPQYNNILGLYIDEPYERGTFTVDQLINIANLTGSTKKLFLGSYWWPSDQCYGFYHYILTQNSWNNVYIMCDKYSHFCLASNEESTWNAFNTQYSPYNQSNWLNAQYNCPDWIDQRFDLCSQRWNTLFLKAKNLGLETVYLYGQLGEDITTDRVHSFCYYAFKNLYLKAKAEHITITEICEKPGDPCGCDPNLVFDDWYIYEIVYHHDYWYVNP